jgi:hypothetical protein
MKVAYLHGLESPNYGPKVDWLNDKFDTYVPRIDYENEDAFEGALDGCRGSSLIIGSSMGGYFAYLIGQHLRIPTLLFNPAVVSRSFDPVVQLSNRNGTKNKIYLCKNDNVIKGSKIKKYFSNEGVGSFKYETYDGGHRVPDAVFISAISETLKIKESRVHSFESFHSSLNEYSIPYSIGFKKKPDFEHGLVKEFFKFFYTEGDQPIGNFMDMAEVVHDRYAGKLDKHTAKVGDVAQEIHDYLKPPGGKAPAYDLNDMTQDDAAEFVYEYMDEANKLAKKVYDGAARCGAAKEKKIIQGLKDLETTLERARDIFTSSFGSIKHRRIGFKLNKDR